MSARLDRRRYDAYKTEAARAVRLLTEVLDNFSNLHEEEVKLFIPIIQLSSQLKNKKTNRQQLLDKITARLDVLGINGSVLYAAIEQESGPKLREIAIEIQAITGSA